MANTICCGQSLPLQFFDIWRWIHVFMVPKIMWYTTIWNLDIITHIIIHLYTSTVILLQISVRYLEDRHLNIAPIDFALHTKPTIFLWKLKKRLLNSCGISSNDKFVRSSIAHQLFCAEDFKWKWQLGN